MKPDEIKHLLGGYATGTLTPEEQKALFDAALEDQDLFDALAREQTLKEALESPATRRELIDVLESKPSWRERFGNFLRWPYQLAGAGALAAAALMAIALMRWNGPGRPAMGSAAQVASVRAPEPELPAAAASQLRKREAKPRKAVTPMESARRVESVPPPEAPAPAMAPTPQPQERKLEQAAAVADSVRPESNVTELRTSLVASEARELFYAPQNAPATQGATSGAGGGVVGGYPATARRGMAMAPRAAAKAEAPGAAGPLGLRYAVLLGQAAPAQLVVESNTDAVLYIFRRDDAGGWVPVAAGGIALKAHSPSTTPGIVVKGQAPEPRAVLILSRAPVTELAQTGAGLSAAINRLRAENTATPLLTESSGGSTFVVTPRPAAIIVTPLALP